MLYFIIRVIFSVEYFVVILVINNIKLYTSRFTADTYLVPLYALAMWAYSSNSILFFSDILLHLILLK